MQKLTLCDTTAFVLIKKKLFVFPVAMKSNAKQRFQMQEVQDKTSEKYQHQSWEISQQVYNLKVQSLNTTNKWSKKELFRLKTK